jgi:hypothetical protein
MPGMKESKARMPSVFGRNYPLAPAIDELVAAIEHRRRRVSYPRWFLKALAARQLFASALVEKLTGRDASEALQQFDRVVAERGAAAASATERTRELTGI